MSDGFEVGTDEGDGSGNGIAGGVVASLGVAVEVGRTGVGAQVRKAFDTSVNTALTRRGMMLAESRLAQLDSGMLVLDPVLIEAGEPIEEDFGRLFPAFATRVTVSETAVEELFQVTLQMLYDRNRDPDDEYDFDESTVLYTLYTLRAPPAFIALDVEFGVEPERIEELGEAVPEAGGWKSWAVRGRGRGRKRGESRSATGRGPVAKIWRTMPPTPVAAPS